MSRFLTHLLSPDWRLKRDFPPATLDAVEQAVRAAEATHRGQIAVALEGALPAADVLRGKTARDRALEVFSHLRVWDTEHNNGVLIYLLLADRDVEIIADRGIHAKAGAAAWEEICQAMEKEFRAGRFREGLVDGVAAVGAHLSRHFAGTAERNELSDRPVIL